MDIIDIMLARAMTPQGQTETYVSIANAAAAKAEKAEEDAAAAIATVNAAASDIEDKQSAAQTLLETAQAAAEAAQAAQLEMLNTEDVDTEIKKLDVSINTVNSPTANTIQVITTYPDNTLNTENITKLYKSSGQNEDGTMTQKAITALLSSATGGGSGANIQFSTDDAGYITMVDENGNLVASDITQDMLIEVLLDNNTYVGKDTVGLDLNYSEKTYTRTQKAQNLYGGSDFDKFAMYGGRVRCNVADDGTINAFYGQNGYTEDGSNGQVMVYQPKFYYRRVQYAVDESIRGNIIRHEGLVLSSKEQSGFKLAPIFGESLDYVLFAAYDGAIANNKMTSIAGILPMTNTNIIDAEAYANARGDGWHIINIAGLSTNQMLQIVEFGTMNGQVGIGNRGIVSNPSNSNVCNFVTGSTSLLGNASGHAETTQANVNGNIINNTTDGYRAISYRGMENPWGNIWQMIPGVNIVGNGSANGGTPYICTDYNYNYSSVGSNYESIGFALPGSYKWISAMGQCNDKYDWIFLPIECTSAANSFLPIGDSIWTVNGLNGINILVYGGSYGFGEECGPFCYGTDRNASESALPKYGAKLMYIPTKNATYTANIAKWINYMGG